MGAVQILLYNLIMGSEVKIEIDAETLENIDRVIDQAIELARNGVFTLWDDFRGARADDFEEKYGFDKSQFVRRVEERGKGGDYCWLDLGLNPAAFHPTRNMTDAEKREYYEGLCDELVAKIPAGVGPNEIVLFRGIKGGVFKLKPRHHAYDRMQHFTDLYTVAGGVWC